MLWQFGVHFLIHRTSFGFIMAVIHYSMARHGRSDVAISKNLRNCWVIVYRDVIKVDSIRIENTALKFILVTLCRNYSLWNLMNHPLCVLHFSHYKKKQITVSQLTRPCTLDWTTKSANQSHILCPNNRAN
jgi:hypothetical protein